MTTLQAYKKQSKLKIRQDDLTARQAQILGYILRCWLDGYMPTCRSIGIKLGIANPNGVQSHIKALRTKGYLSRSVGTCGLSLSDKAIGLVIK